MKGLRRVLLGIFLTAAGSFAQDRGDTAPRPAEDTLSVGINLPNSDAGRKKEAMRLFGDSVNTSNPADSFYYSDRYGKNFPSTYTAAPEDVERVEPSVKDLWDNLQRMRNSETIIGPALIDFSVRAKILYAHQNIGDAWGLWRSMDGIVRMTTAVKLPKDLKLLVLTHETVHGRQQASGLADGDLSVPIGTFQMARLCAENAALVSEKLFALELLHDGVRGPWQQCVDEDPDLAETMLAAWQRACRDSLSYRDALVQAGVAGFEHNIKNQRWLDFYNGQTFMNYLYAMSDNVNLTEHAKDYTIDHARMTGYISPEFNFTAGLYALPKKVFGDNSRMKDAFDYLELQRLACTKGKKDSSYAYLKKKLEKRDNPYLSLGVAQIIEGFEYLKSEVNVVQVMDLLARGTNLRDVVVRKFENHVP